MIPLGNDVSWFPSRFNIFKFLQNTSRRSNDGSQKSGTSIIERAERFHHRLGRANLVIGSMLPLRKRQRTTTGFNELESICSLKSDKSTRMCRSKITNNDFLHIFEDDDDCSQLINVNIELPVRSQKTYYRLRATKYSEITLPQIQAAIRRSFHRSRQSGKASNASEDEHENKQGKSTRRNAICERGPHERHVICSRLRHHLVMNYLNNIGYL
eukprot:gene9607-17366_t